MATEHELPPLSEDLVALLAAEREVPPAPEALRGRLLARVGRTLGWYAAGTGGSGGLGGAKLFLAILATLGIGGAGYVLLDAQGRARVTLEGPEVATAGGVTVPMHARGRADGTLPGWFGDPQRAERVIAGVVTHEGRPVPGARVVLTSNATRAGIVGELEVTSDEWGRFHFGPQRAAVYDVAASAPGRGHGHVRVASIDPSAHPPSESIEVRLSGCDHTLYGVARDASGGFVAGATVSVGRGEHSDVAPTGAAVMTDEIGRYELCVAAGPVVAVVSAQGYGSVAFFETVFDRRRRDVDLVPEAIVVGRVLLGDSDEPVTDALVWLQPVDHTPRIRSTTESAVTGPDGRFRITGVNPGRHRLLAQIEEGSSPVVPVVVEPGEESDEVLLRLELRPVLVEGVVREGGRPVAGARVVAHGEGQRGGGWPPTDADGRFRLRLAKPGAVALQVSDYQVTTPATVEVGPGGATVSVEVASLGAIRGQVSFRGAPVSGAEVIARSATHPARTFARDDGSFELRGLPAGSYSLDARSSRDDATLSDRSSPTLRLEQGETRGGIVLELDAAAAIPGQVFDDEGAPLSFVAVGYANPDTGETCSTSTREDGTFRCGMLAGGGRFIPSVRPDEQSAFAFASANDRGLPEVVVHAGAREAPPQVLRVRARRGSITGQVVGVDGQPRADVLVRAIEEDSGYSPATAPWLGLRTAITGIDGGFALDAWAHGTYSLHARAPGGGEGSLTGVAAGAERVRLQLRDPGTIRGTLSGFDRPPRVVVRAIGNTVDAVDARVDAGTFSATGLPPGAYAVLAVRGAQAAAAELELRDGATVSVALQARATSELRGRVIDFATGRPVPGVRCTAAPYVPGAGIFGLGHEREARSDGQGMFTLEATTGSLEVSCMAHEGRHSEGAAKLTAALGALNHVTVYVVLADTSPDRSNGIGARFHMSHDDAPSVAGYQVSIVELRADGAAARAGLRIGDIIRAVDGRPVSTLTDFGLAQLLGTYRLGTTVTLTIQRGARSFPAAVTIAPPWH